MTLPVHLVDPTTPLAVGGLVELTGDEAHHAVAVRRMRVGEALVLTDGLGRRATGTVAETGKRRLVVRVDDVATEPEPEPRFTVVQALPKGDRGELAVEVLTEVGVATVVPWAASRSVAVWKGERAAKSLARWRSMAREAAKQARRAWFPEVTELAGTDAVVDLVGHADLALVLHEEAGTPLPAAPPTGRVVVVVGPEGGISAEEVARLVEAGAVPVRLGSEVLRTSTAGLAAVSALLAGTARWGAPTGGPQV